MKKKFFTGLFIFAAIGLFIFAHITLSHNNNSIPETNQNLQAPIDIPSENLITNYSEITDIDKPAVIMFYVDWCTYCRRFMPIFGKLANEYKDKYNFAVINCDKQENINLINEYHIMGFPSLFIYDKKINHKFSLNMAAGSDISIMKEELDNYINVRKNFVVQ